jgi:hypothetical protein
MDLLKHRVSICALYCEIARTHAAAYDKHDRDYKKAVDVPAPEEELSQLFELAEKSYEARERLAVIAVTFASAKLRIYMDAPRVRSALLRCAHRKSRMQLYIRPVVGNRIPIPDPDGIC